MKHTSIDFNRISQALASSFDVLKNEKDAHELVMEQLQKARDEFQQALSFSLTSTLK
ncbi:hypothetical protein LS684_13000 [Cytobacillus spongiae]|uniref:hypothetical protein n=1 Tax=Cytobacillus spongiae TaxID=2901381 RepID=UPI001F28DD57|nr:hypothetical protein [Cytobacillus spongiae]UII54583.1 hypothetical protein LS684_13000 [Cytobacillus spongiae]